MTLSCKGLEDKLMMDLSIHADSSLWFDNMFWVPKEEIFYELLAVAYGLVYSIHPRETKMYEDLKQYCWWHGMSVRLSSLYQNIWFTNKLRQSVKVC